MNQVAERLPATREVRAGAATWILAGVGLLALVFAEGAGEPMALVGAAVLLSVGLSYTMARVQGGVLTGRLPRPLRTRAGARARLPVEIGHRGAFLAARDLVLRAPAMPGPFTGTANVGQLVPGTEASVDVVTRFRERGHLHSVQVEAWSGYPLGLFETRLVYQLEADVLVWPRIGRLSAFDDLFRGRRGEGRPLPHRRRTEGDFFALREHRRGEGLSGVHWKLSARRGRLLVRELAAEDEALLRIVLCTATPRPSRRGRTPAYEEAVSLAATLIEAGTQRGRRLSLTLIGTERHDSPAGSGPRHAGSLLTELSTVIERRGDPLSEWRELDACRPGETLLVVFAGDGEPVDEESRDVRFLDVVDPSIARMFDVFPSADVVAPRGVYG